MAVNMGGALGDSTWLDAGQAPIVSFHVPTDPFAPYECGIVNVPIEFKFSVGGDIKKNSSSSILKDWTFPKENRLWGEFYNLYSNPNLKVKELIVFPKQGMSSSLV